MYPAGLLILICVLVFGNKISSLVVSLIGGSMTSGQELAVIILFGLVGIGFLAVLALIVRAILTPARKPRVLDPNSYNSARYKVYRDYLDAVSIGMGRGAPALVVTDFISPLAYVHNRDTIAITRRLLNIGLSRTEIEAIIAVLLARLNLAPEKDDRPGFYATAVEELGLSEQLVKLVREDFIDDGACLFYLVTDAYAARLISQPGAVAKAIRSCDLVNKKPYLPDGIETRMIFVEPSPARRSGIRWPNWLLPKALRQYARLRDRCIHLRLENLDMIELGARQPYEEVRDGLPVTQPPGWE